MLGDVGPYARIRVGYQPRNRFGRQGRVASCGLADLVLRVGGQGHAEFGGQRYPVGHACTGGRISQAGRVQFHRYG
ncbi:hypothetical protein GCM10027290_17950 [Micromonospora sonneratiae]